MATGVTEEQKEQVKTLLAEGMTTNAIAKQLGLSWRKVKDTINELDLVAEEHYAGRKPKYNDDLIDELVLKFKDYIDKTEIPIIAEFAYQNEIPKQILYERDQFSTLIKICTAKKETALERGALLGVLNPTMAVFSLKQMGWTDKQQVESTNHNMNQDVSKLSPEDRRARIDELNRRRRTGTDNSP